MKKKQNINLSQLQDYCNTYNLDQNIFENPNDETNKKQIIQIFENFTGIEYTKDHIVIKQMDFNGEPEDRTLSRDDFPRFWEVSSLEELHHEINRFVDSYNKAVIDLEIVKTSINSLNASDRDTFFTLMEESQKAMDDLNTIAKKRPLTPQDLVAKNRADLINDRVKALEILSQKLKPSIDVVLVPVEKDGSFGDAESVHLSDIPQGDIPNLSSEDVAAYIRSNSSLDPDDLFRSDSFQRNTKEGHDTLNNTLYHFTEHKMVTGTGMEYRLNDDDDQKVVYQVITSFDEIQSLDEFVEHMNQVNSHKARNIALLKYLDRDSEKTKKDNHER
jgi:hypothetical protein